MHDDEHEKALATEDARLLEDDARTARFQVKRSTNVRVAMLGIGLLCSMLALVTCTWLVSSIFSSVSASSHQCESVSEGYRCYPKISRYWGQYSPYFRVKGDLSAEPPHGCRVVFAQLLSRHGGRYPTPHKSRHYHQTIAKIHREAKQFRGPYRFLKEYQYDLGADDLTDLGVRELVDSGTNFYHQYQRLASISLPFIRSAGQERVVASAKAWIDGFHAAQSQSLRQTKPKALYDLLVIPEGPNKNNTLSHSLCAAFEQAQINATSQDPFEREFVPLIAKRISRALHLQESLKSHDLIGLMDLCPFTVVANRDIGSGKTYKKNAFCALFSTHEWQSYDYRQSLGKYFDHGPGSKLGPTQGIGWINELLARLTQSPVADTTSVNHTLDGDAATFPLNRSLYADFSHDNDMMHIFSAMGLFNHVPVLNTTHIMDSNILDGFGASKIVPFASRMVVEKLQCANQDEEMVRIILNGRVWPSHSYCEASSADDLCPLSKFVASQKFARSGGHWNECDSKHHSHVT